MPARAYFGSSTTSPVQRWAVEPPVAGKHGFVVLLAYWEIGSVISVGRLVASLVVRLLVTERRAAGVKAVTKVVEWFARAQESKMGYIGWQSVAELVNEAHRSEQPGLCLAAETLH